MGERRGGYVPTFGRLGSVPTKEYREGNGVADWALRMSWERYTTRCKREPDMRVRKDTLLSMVPSEDRGKYT